MLRKENSDFIALPCISVYHDFPVNPLRYVIGLDGGGTKTAAELCDTAGKVLATTSGGPSNFQVIGTDQAARTIVDLIETCCHSVGCPIGDIGSVVAGLTGAGRVFDQERMSKAVRGEAVRRGLKLRKVGIESDARIALEAAFSGDPGIIVIAGTGSIVFGKSARGKILRSGGWGRVIGDEGSGYALGLELYRAVAAELDGRGKKTKLRALLAKATGQKSQPDIIRAIYHEGFDVASVAPLVTKAAAGRDPVARGIIHHAAEALVGVIEPVVQALGSRARGSAPVPLVFIGSVLTSKNEFSTAVRRDLRKRCPQVAVHRPDASPVHGASLLALQHL